MQNQVNKNDLSVYARLEDVEALLFADRKKFVAKALPYTDNKSTNPYTDYLPVTATVFVRDTEADSDGDLRFLVLEVLDNNCFAAKLQYTPVGLMVPDVKVSDMIQGLNKDCHINPDDTLRVDTLQLIRGVIQATNAIMTELAGVAILNHAMDFGANFNLMNEPSISLLKEGMINLNLIVRLQPAELDALVNTLNTEPHLNPNVRFSVKTLNKLSYSANAPTLN